VALVIASWLPLAQNGVMVPSSPGELDKLHPKLYVDFDDGATAAESVSEGSTTVADYDVSWQGGGGSLSACTDSGPDAGDFTTTTVDSNTCRIAFSAAPDYENPSDEGTNNVYEVNLIATDNNSDTDTLTLTITVTDEPEAPVFTSSPITTATVDQAYAYSITASDQDNGDTLVITATTAGGGALPSWLSLTNAGGDTGYLSGTPASGDEGQLNVVLTVTDSASLTANQAFTLTVSGGSNSTSMNEPGFQAGSIFTYSSLASGQLDTCAILDNSSLYCWGSSLGPDGGSSSTPVAVSLPSERAALSVTIGAFHACAILDNSSLYCWGNNEFGQLGIGSTTTDWSPQFVNLGSGRTAMAVVAGDHHTCAILDDNSLKCWGRNNNGQLGIGGTTDYSSPQPVDLGSNQVAVAINLGQSHVCAIVDNGSLKCWGGGGNGQLGTGSSASYDTPQLVNLGSGRTAAAIAAGIYHTCAILDNASLYCWGSNSRGQLGIGGTTNSYSSPQFVNLGSSRTVVAVEAGNYHTCAILDNASLNCWGRNSHGQLGIGGSTADRTTPQSVDLGAGRHMALSERDIDGDGVLNIFELGLGGSDPPDPRSIVMASSGRATTCAVMDDGALLCWGSLFTSNTSYSVFPLPREIGLGDGASATYVSVGGGRVQPTICVVLDSGSLKCWGWNVNGALGVGDTQNRGSPTEVNLGAGRTAVSVSVGVEHTCAVLDDGSLKCWGWNGYGQVGDGSISTRLTPRTVNLGTGMTALNVSTSFFHTCAILNDSSVKCWGANIDGSLGDGTTEQRVTPTSVNLDAGRGALAISARSERHTCALLDNSSLACWGSNGDGQLGVQNSSNQPNPVYVELDVSDVPVGLATSLDSGDSHTCAVLASGALKCWGSNNMGQLADENDWWLDSHNPRVVNLSSEATQVTAGEGSTCAITVDGWLSCWGHNEYGQRGDGSICWDHEISVDGCQRQMSSGGGTGNHVPAKVYLSNSPAVIQVAAGRDHTCASLTDGTVSCWGANDMGQLGDGSVIEHHYPESIQAQFNNSHNFASNYVVDRVISIDVNDGYSCATFSIYSSVQGGGSGTGGQLWCWGGNTFGTLTDNASLANGTLDPIYIRGSNAFPWITNSAGRYAFCASYDCWGWNGNGSVGLGYKSNQYESGQRTDNSYNSYQLDSGEAHTCAILSDNTKGDVACWGGNWAGQLGEASRIDSGSAATVWLGSGRYAVDVAAGEAHSCAALDDGSLKCWGSNTDYQLGSGTVPGGQSLPQDELTPILVNLGTQKVVGVSAGSLHTCAIMENGGVRCWGDNEFGQLGDGSFNDVNDSSQSSFVDLGVGRTAVSIDAGYYHTCAVLDDYSLKCWGLNDHGQIGDGSTNNSNSPVRLSFGVDSAGEEGPIEDMDEDGIPDSSDDDMDGDGILNIEDDFPTDSTEWGDADSDGTGDNADTDDDNDGWSDTIEGDCLADPLDSSSNPLDSDEDGECDEIDSDDDNDGVADETDAFPLDANEWSDNDLDGIGDNSDTDDDNDGWSDEDELSCGKSPTDPESVPADSDGDGLCDALEDDSDGDSFDDDLDIFPTDPCAAVDTDGDGMPDWIVLNCNTTLIEDTDDDNDGFPDTEDAFPEDPSEWSDTDWDGWGNNADNDDDNDGVEDSSDEFPLDASEWSDNDGDGTGDNADTDDDNDGVEDSLDDFPEDAAASVDTDGDGMADTLVGNISTDLTEDFDDDGDGWLDVYDEFPLDSSEWIDTDGDGIGNNADLDDDNDGWSDSDEYICGTDPLDSNDVPDDEDNDGVCDGEEGDGSMSALIKLIPGGGATVMGLLLILAGVIVGGVVGRRNAFELARRDAEKAILWTDEYDDKEQKEDKKEDLAIEDLNTLADDLDELYDLTKEE